MGSSVSFIIVDIFLWLVDRNNVIFSQTFELCQVIIGVPGKNLHLISIVFIRRAYVHCAVISYFLTGLRNIFLSYLVSVITVI